MTEKEYIEKGYVIRNARIANVSLNFKDHGCLVFDLTLEGSGWGTVYGGYCLGNGYLGADNFEGSGKGLEAIMRIMNTVGVDDIMDLKNKYIRVAYKHGETVHAIGNIIKEEWFDYKEFYKQKGQ